MEPPQAVGVASDTAAVARPLSVTSQGRLVVRYDAMIESKP